MYNVCKKNTSIKCRRHEGFDMMHFLGIFHKVAKEENAHS